MPSRTGESTLEIRADEIGSALAGRITYNPEKELSGADEEELVDGGHQLDSGADAVREAAQASPASSKTKAPVVFILSARTSDAAGVSPFSPYEMWMTKLVAWMRLEREQWDYAPLPAARDAAGMEIAFKYFLDQTYPSLEANPPKFILSFGAEAAYPFFKGEKTKNPKWFDDVHSRLHQKKVKGHHDPILLFCMPALSICNEPALKENTMLAMRQVRGILIDQGISKPPPAKNT